MEVKDFEEALETTEEKKGLDHLHQQTSTTHSKNEVLQSRKKSQKTKTTWSQNTAAKQRERRGLGDWSPSIINHFRWSALTCESDAEVLKEKWVSVIEPDTNWHNWPGNYHWCARESVHGTSQRSFGPQSAGEDCESRAAFEKPGSSDKVHPHISWVLSTYSFTFKTDTKWPINICIFTPFLNCFFPGVPLHVPQVPSKEKTWGQEGKLSLFTSFVSTIFHRNQ